AADRVAQEIGIGGAHVDEPLDAARAQLAGGDRADAPQHIDLELLQERLDFIWADDRETVRLFPSGCDLREKLVRRDAGRCRQPRLLADTRLQAPGDARRRRLAPLVLGDVE